MFNKYLVHIIIITQCLFLASCIEKELPILPHETGDLIVNSPSIGSNYRNQLYYSISNNEIVASNIKTDWCFSLQSNNDSILLGLNSSRYPLISSLGEIDPSTEITEEMLENMVWALSPPEGAGISHLSHFLAPETLYIIDRGRDTSGDYLGYARLYITDFSNPASSFTLTIESLNQDSAVILPITLDSDGARSHFSAITFDQKEIEPPLDEYDIWITQYTELLDEESPYLVTGILTPGENTTVYQAPFSQWDSLLISDWSNLEFSSEWNAIGFDWKSYDINAGTYSIDTERLYCIKTDAGREFLIRILDFYDDSGSTGTFTFESIER